MDEKKKAKTAAILIAAIILALFCASNPTPEEVGIYKGCGLLNRCTYAFFHANCLHLALNLWSFLSVFFLLNASAAQLLGAFAISCATPNYCLGTIPTLGLSGVIYALIAMNLRKFQNVRYAQTFLACSMLLCFCFNNTNAWLHVYCYAVGLLWTMFNTPFNLNSNERSQ